MNDWKPVVQALLGSWPSQVSAWGRDAIAAYVAEIEVRGVTPDDALVAIRRSDGSFPPSAGEVAATARDFSERRRDRRPRTLALDREAP